MGIRATINLLNASTVVALSGGLRLHIALMLVGKEPIMTLSIAMSLIVYAIYTLDRTIESKEDVINRAEEDSANKNLSLFIICVSFLAAIFLLKQNKIFPLIAFYPLIIGFIYSKGLKIGNFSLKLKQGLGVKNFVVAFIWASTIIALIYPAENLQLLLVFIFFFLKSFINTVLFDCKDIKGDLEAGLNTFPVYFGEKKTRMALQIVHSSFHLIAIALIIVEVIKFDAIVLLYSWIGSMIYIPLYGNSKKMEFRSLIIHGEWAYILMFRFIVNHYFRPPFIIVEQILSPFQS